MTSQARLHPGSRETKHGQTLHAHRRVTDCEVVGIIGLAVMTIGLIAVTRAGVDVPVSQPGVEVLGFTRTATLGAIEVGIGFCLSVSTVVASRAAAVFFGFVLGIGATVAAVQTDSTRRSLAIQSPLTWIAAVAAAVVIVSSLLMVRASSRTTRLERPES